MAYEQILYEKADRVAKISLYRPEKRNAYTHKMEAELLDALRQAETDPEVNVVVLCGSGKAFCVGADVNVWDKGLAEREKAGDKRRNALVVPVSYRTSPDAQQHDLIRQLLRMTRPVIVAIHGYAIGIGATIPLACDIRLVADNARVGFIFVKRGLTPEAGSTYLLQKIVGVTNARDLLLTGRVIEALEAKEMGLATELVPEVDLMARAMEVARGIADSPSVAVSFIKRGLNLALDASLEEIFDYEHWAFYTCMNTEDFGESIRSFLEKREPQFRGR